MVAAMVPLRIWRAWTTPVARGELAARREAILLTTLAGAVVLSVATQILQLVVLALEANANRVLTWLVNLFVSCVFAVLLRRARRGHQRQTAAFLVGIFCALAVGLQLIDGINNPMCPLLLALAVLLTAMLLGGAAAATVLGIIAAVVLPIVALQHANVLQPFWLADSRTRSRIGDGIGLFAVLAYIVYISWLYTRDLLTGIDEALTHSSPSSPLRQLRTKTLTMREIEVVQLVADGLSNETIAKRLFLSPRTVQSHVANAMKKTDCTNRTELGVLAVREGLVPLAPGHDSPAPGTGSVDVASRPAYQE